MHITNDPNYFTKLDLFVQKIQMIGDIEKHYFAFNRGRLAKESLPKALP